ncbi:MAG TPA: hypothetical protein VM056_04920 [Terriglobales bacterium]|nr:hypothetical protein [Terriglobales bacterium]
MLETGLKYFTWFGVPALMATLAFLMARRKLQAQFPFFFTYAIFQVVSHILHYMAYGTTYKNYFYTYWTTTALGIILGFFVIYEVFQYAIRPYTGLRDLGTMLFHWAGLVLLLVSGVIAFSTRGNSADHIIIAIVNLERGIRLMQCGMLLFIAVFASHLGLTWRNFACGIAFGFGIFASTDLTMYSLRAQLGPSWNLTLSTITNFAYMVSAITWLGVAYIPQSLQVRSGIPFHARFDRWNQAALSVIGAGRVAVVGMNEPAYLSELQRTVDDVMAGKTSRS